MVQEKFRRGLKRSNLVNADAADVIVVGGGTAGGATAILCAQRGLKTLVLESRTDVAEIPGETLHPGIEPLFRALGVEREIKAAKFRRHCGYLINSNDTVSTNLYGSDARGVWYGYQADRGTLQTILLDRAEACGATMLRGTRALCPIFHEGRIAGIVSSAGVHRAQFVVDASGHAHWLMRQLRLPVLEISPRLIAFFGWGVPDNRANAPPQGLPEFVMREVGWAWRAPIRDDRHAWVYVDLEPDLSRLRGNIRPRCPDGLLPLSKTGARDVSWRIARPSAGPGYFLAGDAAWVLDPACSHGVLFCFLSAMAAFDSIVKLLASDEEPERIQARYSTWTERWFCRDAAALISLYGRMEKSPGWLSSATAAVRYIAMSSSERALSSRRS
jgi:flavin-dependent dehydrogenase